VTGPLVTTEWLRERLTESGLRIVDCRYVLGRPGAGEPLWREGHIPGAAFMDLDRDLASPPGERGRHPLPDADAFEAAARRAGIGSDSLVVAYDEAAEGGAARLWWLLRHFGHDNVTVLDGGLREWRAQGGDLRAGDEKIEPGDFRARAPANDTVTSAEPRRARPAKRPRCSTAVRLCLSTLVRRSGIAGRSSQSIGLRGTSRVPAASRSRSSLRTVASSRRPSCAPASRQRESSPVTKPSPTAARA
jgi:hypothetical protein